MKHPNVSMGALAGERGFSVWWLMHVGKSVFGYSLILVWLFPWLAGLSDQCESYEVCILGISTSIICLRSDISLSNAIPSILISLSFVFYLNY